MPKLILRSAVPLTLPTGYVQASLGRYLSGYINQCEPMGSSIGCESNGLEVWSDWWFSAHSSLQASVRHQTASSQFFRGGDLRDISVSPDPALQPDRQPRGAAPQERWRLPLFATSTANNFTTTMQLSYRSKAKELS